MKNSIKMSMTRQKTFAVNGLKIKVISIFYSDLIVRTSINRIKYYSNVEIMQNWDKRNTNFSKETFMKEFIKRAMDKAYVEWVKKYT